MDKTQAFIEKANTVHCNLYTYNKSVYIKSNIKLIITCSLHGDFEKTPHQHVTFKTGCPTCSKNKSKVMSTNEFVEKANKKHNNYFNYSETIYKGTFEKVLIKCPKNHTFTQRANDHLNGSGCSVCSNKNKLDFAVFIKTANSIHNNYYKYDKVTFKNRQDTVSIECPVHGFFKQTVRSHLQGSGCKKCGYKYSGWSATIFKEKCIKNNNGLGILYVIRCFNKNEEFYKIGITSKSIKHRYRDKTRMPYFYEVIQEISGEPLDIYNIETELHKLYKNQKYTPLIEFGGFSTECFISKK